MKNYLQLLALLLISISSFAQHSNLVFNVYDYGAKGDGTTNDQESIQKTIDACKNTGGIVHFPKGNFLTGQLVLGSNMTLRIDTDATLIGIQSDDEKAYPHGIINTRFPNRMKDDCQRRLIYGDRVRHVTITGGGTINGQGDFALWMNTKELGTEKDRPSLLAFVSSQDITVSNITLLKPACWTQVYIECDSVTIQNIKVNTGYLTPNRDGIDIVDCHHVLIEDSSIQSEDDGICFKSGSEWGCKDVVVRRCTIDKQNVKAGNCFKLGTDGLGSFMNFDVSNLTMKNCLQNSAIAIESVDGAIIDNLTIRECEMNNVGQAFFILLGNRGRTVEGRKKRIGTISNVSIRDIKGQGFTQSYPSIITGMKGHRIQNISFENIQLKLKGGITVNTQKVNEYDGQYPEGSKFGNTNAHAFFIRHTDEVSFINCSISVESKDAREWVITDDVGKVKTE